MGRVTFVGGCGIAACTYCTGSPWTPCQDFNGGESSIQKAIVTLRHSEWTIYVGLQHAPVFRIWSCNHASSVYLTLGLCFDNAKRCSLFYSGLSFFLFFPCLFFVCLSCPFLLFSCPFLPCLNHDCLTVAWMSRLACSMSLTNTPTASA